MATSRKRSQTRSSSSKQSFSKHIFASIEVTRLKAPGVSSLNVVMVLKKNAKSDCTNASLKNLQNQFDPNITYTCKDVAEHRVEQCGSQPEITCGACW